MKLKEIKGIVYWEDVTLVIMNERENGKTKEVELINLNNEDFDKYCECEIVDIFPKVIQETSSFSLETRLTTITRSKLVIRIMGKNKDDRRKDF